MNNDFHVDDEGLHLFTAYEGLGPNKKGDRFYSYLCQSGKLTIGYGHVIQPGELFTNGLTVDEALSLLKVDLARFESKVKKDCSIPLRQYEFNSLVSLVFNAGEAPMVQTIGTCLRHNLRPAAASHFLDWILAGPPGHLHVSEGLVRRRLCEANYFLHGKLELVLTHDAATKMLDKLIAERILNSHGRYNEIRRLT